jgi:putative peptide zinc metalloprotease protein
MSEDLYSPHWYRVAKLKPKLHSHIEIHRHDYRGLIWYIIEDKGTGRNHRFNPAAYQFIGLLDGIRSVQEISEVLNKQLGDFAPGQEEIIQLMGQLHNAELMQTDVLINTEELFERQSRFKKTKLNQQLTNPISQKIPLWDPEEFLEKNMNKLSWVFSTRVGFTWLFVVLYSGLQAATNWGEITGHLDVNTLSPYNFLTLFFLYPPIKILHELGHAFATKLKGGEVHEMGINFIMFVPVPYVNVSSSGNFRNKYDRMLVSAAGILVETFLAALGLLLFLSAEPGIIQDIGFNVLLIGGVSSLFFNGNPLLKYDGYYILADAIGIPNLYQRSAQYWHYFFQRYLFGLTKVTSPATAPDETFWFIAYSTVSVLYRLSMLWFICIYVTEKYFILGLLLALWLVSVQILIPIYKVVLFVIKSPTLNKKRSKAAMTTILLGVITLAFLGYMPIPSYILTEGIVWLPDEALIKAEQNGFIESVQLHSNQMVNNGDVVLLMNDDSLESKARVARAKLFELQSKFRAERETDIVKADILKEELHVAESQLEHLNTKIRAMTIKASKNGQILLPEADDLPGRYIHHGELIGYILDDSPPTIRMVVTQDNIGLVRNGIVDIKVRLSNDPNHQYDATIIRQAPEASNRLPSPALATIGGGKIQIDPNNKKELITLQKTFWIDLKFNPKDNIIPIGTRAYVRINHGGEALSTQWYRRIRQAFLRHFNV